MNRILVHVIRLKAFFTQPKPPHPTHHTEIQFVNAHVDEKNPIYSDGKLLQLNLHLTAGLARKIG